MTMIYEYSNLVVSAEKIGITWNDKNDHRSGASIFWSDPMRAGR